LFDNNKPGSELKINLTMKHMKDRKKNNQRKSKAKGVHHGAHKVHGEKQDMAKSKSKSINHGEHGGKMKNNIKD